MRPAQGGRVTFGPPQWPRARKGHTLTHVTFRPDGSVRSSTFTPVERAKRTEDKPVHTSRRGVVRETLFD